MKLPKFLEKLWKWIVKEFTNINPELEKIGTIAVKVVEGLKSMHDSGMDVLITSLIPGDVDDKIREKLMKIIPEALSTSTIIRDSASLTPDQALNEWLTQAAKLTGLNKAGELLTVAAKIEQELAKDLEDGDLSDTELQGLAFSIFNGFIKKR